MSKLSLRNVKLSSFTRIGLIVVGVALVLWLALTLWPDGPTRSNAAKTDPTRCPECGLPLTKQAQLTGECPSCAMARGDSKSKKPQTKIAQDRVVPTFLIGLFVVLMGAHLFALYRRRPAAIEVVLYYHHCPKCGRKLRYRTHQVGQFARCPICRQLVRFPPLPDEPRKPWWQVWKKRQSV